MSEIKNSMDRIQIKYKGRLGGSLVQLLISAAFMILGS